MINRDYAILSHGKWVQHGSVWLVRSYTPAKPAHKIHPKFYPAMPACVDWDIARAFVDEGIDDDTDEICMQIGWRVFGSEFTLGGEYLARGKFVQPVKLLAVSVESLVVHYEGLPLPDDWKL